MSNLLSFYHSLPYPLRVLAASARGAYLRWWRYGPETERLVEEALERETWSAERWKAWQEERLAWMLHHAATQVPYYREQWSHRRRQGDRASWEVLENWQVLEKSEVKKNPKAFVSEVHPQFLFEDHTSGTTGTPLSVYMDRDSLHLWYALYECRIRRWNGVSIHDPWGIMGGQLVTPVEQYIPPYWVYNFSLNQLYLSTFHLHSDRAKDYVDALIKHRISHLVVYPSSAGLLASFILDQGLNPPPLKVIISNAEMLTPRARQIMSLAFHCPVRNTYGMGEYIFGASECEYGKMHIWPEAGILEILSENGEICHDNTEGEFIITGLLNPHMPFIRYRVGDRGSLGSGEACRCGRNLPLLGEIYGRANDMITLPDGRKIFWINPVFYNLPVQEGQVIQLDLYTLHVRYVADKGFSDATEKEIIHRLRQRVGEEMHITLERVDTIPRGPNGKFQSVVSKIH
ncbi:MULTISPECIES: phenylacetate--CoA ligase family protein [Anaerolinea]|uniref:phenylacetate--CoA ligase family protein n=1 Tax=Anaerolinea TaxID=233189 RepID=UPI00260AA7E8|nr:AMP-binding protein [Anaerolinea thermophila]